MRRDATTGLYTTPNREYSATLGNWLQTDPAGYPDGLNAYAFVSGRPTYASDPSGLALYAFDGTRNYPGETKEENHREVPEEPTNVLKFVRLYRQRRVYEPGIANRGDNNQFGYVFNALTGKRGRPISRRGVSRVDNEL